MTLPPSSPTPVSGERSALPVVARPRSGLSGTAIAIGAGVAALALFGVLEARRQSASAPAVSAGGAELAVAEAPPPLYIPPEPAPAYAPQQTALPTPAPALAVAPLPRAQPSAVAMPVQPLPQQAFVPQQPAERPARNSGGSALVIDSSQTRGGGEQAAGAAAPGQAPSGMAADGTAARVSAGTIANRATTVPQGTLIPAVLETAFNSSRAGFARALVRRDVRGFDGTKVLIPRGSRLIGEYRSDATSGQKRALINWTRLIRPDGVTIAIGSPATDPLGTGGIKAKVNSHFFERFAGAILQSALDVGVTLAARSVDSSVLVLPGALQGGGAGAGVRTPNQIPPTLSVRQGTSVSVFVARDLDFTEVEGRQ